ncbi:MULTISPECIES: response regulator [unclassified Caballeronia]|uniref:response regulator n=1 Tax=unclassified Caballeronia TaxID=2646786 RepID=UPI002858474C|nr:MULTISPECIES: response regulator [unclassified Caballeronia]MDR5752885.1 response regulator [Caballeronia sp. LZ024]MDR5845605.1 response regulator [Caballeronia sp. LZ031]
MHLLFVDDSCACAEILADIAVSVGHTAAIAHDGAECLALTAVQRFDRIFLDIGLPDADGRDVCDRIRSEGPSRNATIIAITGNADVVQRSDPRCFNGYLLKPVALADFETTLSADPEKRHLLLQRPTG